MFPSLGHESAKEETVHPGCGVKSLRKAEKTQAAVPIAQPAFHPLSLFGEVTDTGPGCCEDKARYSDGHMLRAWQMGAIMPQQPDLGFHLAAPEPSPRLAQAVAQNVNGVEGDSTLTRNPHVTSRRKASGLRPDAF